MYPHPQDSGVPIFRISLKRPPLRQSAKTFSDFWLAHWKFLITTALVIIGLIIAYLELQH